MLSDLLLFLCRRLHLQKLLSSKYAAKCVQLLDANNYNWTFDKSVKSSEWMRPCVHITGGCLERKCCAKIRCHVSDDRGSRTKNNFRFLNFGAVATCSKLPDQIWIESPTRPADSWLMNNLADAWIYENSLREWSKPEEGAAMRRDARSLRSCNVLSKSVVLVAWHFNTFKLRILLA